MAESQDLSLLSSTGPKCRGDQSQKSDEKWGHRGNDDDLTNRSKACIFNSDGVFGIDRGVPTRIIPRRQCIKNPRPHSWARRHGTENLHLAKRYVPSAENCVTMPVPRFWGRRVSVCYNIAR
jgi:hypothetical protein